ncbi:MAG: YbhB/YbcL family Raf kinase inhibitor-like protein [Nanoarchaeota archaeon]
MSKVKKALLFLLMIFIIGCTITKEYDENKDILPETKKNTDISEGGEEMKLISNDFDDGDMIPRIFTCQGDDINPHLAWEGVPPGTKSLALIVDDPDAPVGTWVHWLVKDITTNTKEIKKNSIPGNQLPNDFGKTDYGGPCPPSGTHRYFFKLYALNVEKLEAKGKDDLYKQVKEHAIAKAELMGKYQKS